jgi:hypothetical protein
MLGEQQTEPERCPARPIVAVPRSSDLELGRWTGKFDTAGTPIPRSSITSAATAPGGSNHPPRTIADRPRPAPAGTGPRHATVSRQTRPLRPPPAPVRLPGAPLRPPTGPPPARASAHCGPSLSSDAPHLTRGRVRSDGLGARPVSGPYRQRFMVTPARDPVAGRPGGRSPVCRR